MENGQTEYKVKTLVKNYGKITENGHQKMEKTAYKVKTLLKTMDKSLGQMDNGKQTMENG